MINSRSLNDLLPIVRVRVKVFISACADDGIHIIPTSTFRDVESQNELYAQGRTKPGRIVTNAKGGFSFHQYKCAVDVVPIVNGKCDWDDAELWERIGKIGESCGLEWAGRWLSFKEICHFQYTAGLTIRQLQSGMTIPDA